MQRSLTINICLKGPNQNDTALEKINFSFDPKKGLYDKDINEFKM